MIDDPYYEVRQAAAEQISRDRAAHGLGPVELDPLASQVGDRHCQEMSGRGFLSHWNLHGLLPYQRYHLAGGREHVQENLSRVSIFSLDPAPIATPPAEILKLLLQSHQRFMEEKPPLDGHRRNLLKPGHTHVGIGFGVVGGEFTFAELFLNRFARIGELPQELPKGQVRVEGEMLRKEFGPYYGVLFFEGTPRPRTVSELERTYSYSDMEGEIVGNAPPWTMRFERSSGRFRFSLRFRDRGPGYYHLVLWIRDDVRSIPYSLPFSGTAHVDTKDAVPTAGWLFLR